MDFPPRNLSKFNEQDVREEVLAPMLKELGYAKGTDYDILREVQLAYPRASIGRRKHNKDPELKGKADYICKVKERIAWVVEAKSPEAGISIEDIEQAYSYANHPNVRAIFFCLCNGLDFRIYRTNHGPDTQPIFSTTYDELSSSFETIRNILSPQSLERDHGVYVVDVGKPIGIGLRSLCKIKNGRFVFERVEPPAPGLIGFTYVISGGSVYRTEKGNIEFFIIGQSSYSQSQSLSVKLGFHKWLFSCNEEFLSNDANRPTVIFDEPEYVFPQNEIIPNPWTGENIKLEAELTMVVPTTLTGSLCGKEFSGKFDSEYLYSVPQLNHKISGPFTIHLD